MPDEYVNKKYTEQEKLWYSKPDSLLFFVPSYYVDGSKNASTIVDSIMRESVKLSKHSGTELKKIQTDICLSSSRYKHCRYFYVSCTIDQIPEAAFVSNKGMLTILEE